MSAPFKERPASAEHLGEGGVQSTATAAAPIWLVDQHGRLRAANGALTESRIRDPQLRAAIQRVLVQDVEISIELAIDDFSQIQPRTLARVRRLIGEDGPLALVEILTQAPQSAIERRDPLTELADRNALHSCINDWRRNAKRPVCFTLLFLDLDGFKQINDRHGHAAGDNVLKTLASRWQACVRDGDLVVRYGGDEFVVLVHEATSADEISSVIRRLRQATEQPLDVAETAANLQVTIGVAICTSDDASIDDLLAAADRDMYAQKRNSRNRADDA